MSLFCPRAAVRFDGATLLARFAVNDEDSSHLCRYFEACRIPSAARPSTLRRHTLCSPCLRRRRPANAAEKVEGEIIEEGLEIEIKKETKIKR
mmetsp:Transcript_26072/g.56048  ORF Transcript_26072/g.56048 Transcript_26072/m.56048 type:complete len:93 (-) Transcript_26072:813-1091(-)